MEALQTATFNNAKVMNQEKELGTLETGKYPDPVILNGNPPQDIRQTKRLHLIIKHALVLNPQK